MRPEEGARHKDDCPFQVLIAHQSTIPSYRVAFYDLLNRTRPDHWEFKVVYDCPVSDQSGAAKGRFGFPVFTAPVRSLPGSSGKLRWQNFLSEARHADVLVLDTLLSNLSYPVAALSRHNDKKLIFWGHTSDLNVDQPGLIKKTTEKVKRAYLARCHGFFAYTEEESRRAQNLGISPDKITTLYNTIDISAQRQRYEQVKDKRDIYRHELGFTRDTKVLLLLGRLIRERRIDFLLSAFESLPAAEDWRLLVVGDGPELCKVLEVQQRLGRERVVVTGRLTDPDKKAQIYMSSDLFVMPGMVGLAPLEAIAYDLPVVAFNLPIHSPEFAYLSAANSTILGGNTTPSEFAGVLKSNPGLWHRHDAGRYESVKHLTLERMVRQFCSGINNVIA